MRLIESLYSFLSKYSFLLPLGVVTLTIIMLVLTLLPSNFMGHTALWDYDKLGHMALFTSWCLTVGLYYQISREIPVKPWFIFASGITFGLLIEVLQYALPLNRHADPVDFLFDAFGCLLAVWLLNIIQPKKTKKSTPTPPA